MRFALATSQVPHPDGAAAGRQLWALADALLAAGHQVEGWYWAADEPRLPMPDWCEWSPQHGPVGWTAPFTTIRRPRGDSAGGGWRPSPDAIRWADDWRSWPAVAETGGRSLLTVHYDVATDARATHDRSLPRLQDWRAQRRAVRGASTVVALSHRVARAAAVATTVPATLPFPTEPVPFVEEPVALMLANWEWRPNALALQRLLASWPSVTERVPGAVLLVAGRGSAEVGNVSGVRVIGEVPRTVDAMARAAVFAFPCPPTSGPKMKVLDACGAGLPVVTTAAGVEGIDLPDAAVAVTSGEAFARTLADVLADPVRRARMAADARAAVLAHHAPAVAMNARLRALGVVQSG